jgi:preprotein translocase subunit SecD
VYRSRSQFREVASTSTGRGAKNARARGEADRRQTIAERKRAEALAGERPGKSDSSTSGSREGDA